MIKNEEITQQEQTINPHAASHTAAAPRRKRFWEHPWFILGAIVFALSITFALMNNSEVTINFIGASMKIKLPLLILSCALIGAAIEFFSILGPRSDSRAEIHRLKQQIRELKALAKHPNGKKEK